MSRTQSFFVAILVLTGTTGVHAEELAVDRIMTDFGEIKVTFIGHGSLMFEWRERVIHVDPWSKLADYTKLPKADVILITHDHQDHLDPDAIAAIRKEVTHVIVPPKCVNQVPGSTAMKIGDSGILKAVRVKAVPAYNIANMRPDGQPYHAKGDGNGYVLQFSNVNIYIAGDTENIPEMKDLGDIQYAFLPMNLPYTMTPEMVADAAKVIHPKILYPYHFGESDTSKLVELLKGTDIEVRIRNLK